MFFICFDLLLRKRGDGVEGERFFFAAEARRAKAGEKKGRGIRCQDNEREGVASLPSLPCRLLFPLARGREYRPYPLGRDRNQKGQVAAGRRRGGAWARLLACVMLITQDAFGAPLPSPFLPAAFRAVPVLQFGAKWRERYARAHRGGNESGEAPESADAVRGRKRQIGVFLLPPPTSADVGVPVEHFGTDRPLVPRAPSPFLGCKPPSAIPLEDVLSPSHEAIFYRSKKR